MHLALRLLLAAATIAGSSCLGGPCSYDTAVTGTVEVTAIGASTGTCSDARYTWTTGGPSRYSNSDHLAVTDTCVDAGTVKVGTTFQVKREDELSGTCTPSMRTVLDDAVKACACP